MFHRCGLPLTSSPCDPRRVSVWRPQWTGARPSAAASATQWSPRGCRDPSSLRRVPDVHLCPLPTSCDLGETGHAAAAWSGVLWTFAPQTGRGWVAARHPGTPQGSRTLPPAPPRLPHLRSELRGCRLQRQRCPTSAPRSPRRCGVSLVTSANVPQIGAWECQVSGRSGPDSACFCGVTVVTVMRFPGLRRDGEPSTPERALLLLASSSLSQGHFARPAGIMLFTRYVFGNNLVVFFVLLFAQHT